MSEYKYLDKDGLIYYHSKVKTLLSGKVDVVSGKGLSTNDYTTTEKNKLSGIASGAEVNQNAFSNVVVGETTIAADTKTDTLTLEAGNNVTLTPNATSDKITIAAKDTTYSDATQSTHGLMSATDKTKLDGIAEGANKTTVDSAMSSSSTNPVQNKVINTALGNKANLASPTFTGTPKAPTAAAGTNTTQIATTAFVKSEITTAISGITGIDFQIVQTLPQTGTKGVIYLVPNNGQNPNSYDEYIWITSGQSGSFEKIGTTDVDLSGYVQATEMVKITNAEIDAIVAA